MLGGECSPSLLRSCLLDVLPFQVVCALSASVSLCYALLPVSASGLLSFLLPRLTWRNVRKVS